MKFKILQRRKDGKTASKQKIVFCAQNPVDYHAGIYREFFGDEHLDVSVLYYSNIGADTFFEPEFRIRIALRPDLLHGYKYRVLWNLGTNKVSGFFSKFNPTLIYWIIRERPDLIIIHGYSTLSDILAMVTAKLLGITIAMKGEAVKEYEDDYIKLKIKKIILVPLLKMPKYFLYSCELNKQYWMEYGAKSNACIPFICAVDNDKYHSDFLAKEKYRNKLIEKIIPKKYHNTIKILWIGRFTERKNPLLLLKALTLIQGMNITAVMVGDGELRECLRAFAREHSIPLVMPGFIDAKDIGDFYTISDIFINTSLYDPSPKTVNEAMNYCLPLLLSNKIGTIFELLEKGQNGESFTPTNEYDLVDKIKAILKNSDLTNKMGRKSLEIVGKYNFRNNKRMVIDEICK